MAPLVSSNMPIVLPKLRRLLSVLDTIEAVLFFQLFTFPEFNHLLLKDIFRGTRLTKYFCALRPATFHIKHNPSHKCATPLHARYIMLRDLSLISGSPLSDHGKLLSFVHPGAREVDVLDRNQSSRIMFPKLEELTVDAMEQNTVAEALRMRYNRRLCCHHGCVVLRCVC